MSEAVNMRPLWDAVLSVYDEFARVCTANGLCFFVGEGNAIGALRHGGFIPWDDDMDVMMPRPDYERFRKICAAVLPPHLKFLDWRNVPEHRYMFGKVQDCREAFVRDIERKTGRILADGIYIDILVIDAMPDSLVARMAYKAERFTCKAMRRRWETVFSQWKWRGRLVWMYGWAVSLLLSVRSRDEAYARMENLMESVPFEGASFTWREGALERTSKMKIPARVWNGYVAAKFEGRDVPLPAGYDEYLRMQYGDYMTPLAKAERVSTHVRTKHSPWWLGPTRPKAT